MLRWIVLVGAATTVGWAATALVAAVLGRLRVPSDLAVVDRLIDLKGARRIGGMEAADHERIAQLGAKTWTKVAGAQRRHRKREAGAPRRATRPRVVARRTGTTD